jgi:hypothetical protein
MKMKSMRMAALAAVLALVATGSVFASYNYYLRQYYTPAWTYTPAYGYYYTTYYYTPTVIVEPVVVEPVYTYHYAIYYPAQPTYVYYYNPVSQVYWGRYAVGSKGEKRYSILAKEDRKKSIKDIDESKFPAPAAMPSIPGAEDKVAMLPPPEDSLPKLTK